MYKSLNIRKGFEGNWRVFVWLKYRGGGRVLGKLFSVNEDRRVWNLRVRKGFESGSELIRFVF